MASGGTGIVEEPKPYLTVGQFDDMPPIPIKEEIAQPESILVVVGGYVGECVPYMRHLLGDIDFYGNAWDIEPNWDAPDIGLIVITTEGGGHVAYIDDIVDGYLILSEANFNGDNKVTHGRKLSVDSDLIVGYKKV